MPTFEHCMYSRGKDGMRGAVAHSNRELNRTRTFVHIASSSSLSLSLSLSLLCSSLCVCHCHMNAPLSVWADIRKAVRRQSPPPRRESHPPIACTQVNTYDTGWTKKGGIKVDVPPASVPPCE